MIAHKEDRALTMILQLKFTQNEYKRGNSREKCRVTAIEWHD